jgi:hypothetical protein
VDFEGAINTTTISCDVVNRTRNQINTEWSVTNFKGVSSFQILNNNSEIFEFTGDPIPGTIPTQTFRNRVTILVLSNDMDRVTLFCGSDTFPAQTVPHFFFRIYRKSYPINHSLAYYIIRSSFTVTVNFMQARQTYIKRLMYESRKVTQKLQLIFVKTQTLSPNQVSSTGARTDGHYQTIVILFLPPTPM